MEDVTDGSNVEAVAETISRTMTDKVPKTVTDHVPLYRRHDSCRDSSLIEWRENQQR